MCVSVYVQQTIKFSGRPIFAARGDNFNLWRLMHFSCVPASRRHTQNILKCLIYRNRNIEHITGRNPVERMML